ncbi:MAG TPA: hypothetical protein VN848_06585, partial [Gemmatimonadales bacterium]|nr:hypothetical protein [Gemmatimonadales bacterium]
VTSETGVDAVNGPFAASLSIKAGDAIAIQPTDDSLTPSHEGTFGSDGIRYFGGPVAEAASAEVLSEENNGQTVPVQATVEYTPEGEKPPPPPPPAPPANTSPPTLSGGSGATVKAGQTLQCATGAWSGSPALKVVWYQQPNRPRLPTPPALAVPLGLGVSLKLPSLAPGSHVFCQVTATTGALSNVATTSTLLVKAIKPALLPAKLAGRLGAKPRVLNRVSAGNVDSCTTGLWQNYPSSFKYQWQLHTGNARGAAARLTARTVGHSPTIKIRPSYAGSSLTCKVTATNQAGRSVSAADRHPFLGSQNCSVPRSSAAGTSATAAARGRAST